MSRLSILFFVFVFGATSFAALTPEKRGLEIAKKLDAQDDGFGDQKSKMEMILKDRKGKTSKREIRNRSLEVAGDGDKSLVIFDKPGDVRGTKFLSFTHKSGPDDQWIFLPKLKRKRRITSKNKSGPFLGSEFAYEDIASQEVEKYTYKFIKDEKCPDSEDQCHQVERYPVDKNSGYKRQVVWVNQKLNRVEKIDFYDRKDSHLKTLTFKGYKKYLDQYWRPNQMIMKNHQKGKETTLVFTDYKFRNGFTKRDFDQNSLKRIK